MKHLVWLASTAILAFSGTLVSGANCRTTNFYVTAPTQQIADIVGQAAEKYRKERAVLWLGQELPTWSQPCPITVEITKGGCGGATSFTFGRTITQTMQVQGPCDRIVASVLPHEVTHTLLAGYFNRPVPRWCDEGIAVANEDVTERRKIDMACRERLNNGQAMPLSRLLTLTDYPSDMLLLYGEGYTLTNFLLGHTGTEPRRRLMGFLAAGMQGNNWDAAVQRWYGYSNVAALEKAWLADMKATKGAPRFHPEADNGSVPLQTQPLPPGASQPITKATPNGVTVTTFPGSDTAQILTAIQNLDRSVQMRLSDHERRLGEIERRLGISGTLAPAQPQPWRDVPQRQVNPVYEMAPPGSRSPSGVPCSPGRL